MESILEGTWGSGPAPPQWNDFVLMRRMHWSWEQLEATPLTVRRYCSDFLNLVAQVEQDRNEQQQAAQRRQQQGM